MIKHQKQVKIQKIKNFIQQHADAPKQGTAEWHMRRGIGGSEMHTLITSPAELIAQKVGLAPGPPDLLMMKWGHIFEPVLRDFMADLLHTQIFETSSVPSAQVPGKTYSPDGIGLVKMLCDSWDDKPYQYMIDIIALFEFKSLYSRVPEHGRVFDKYIPQVLSGMCDLDIPDICIYVEGVFRLANVEDLRNSPDCITWLQRDPNPNHELPIMYSFVGLYIDNRIANPWEPDSGVATRDLAFLDWDCQGATMQDFTKLRDPKKLNTLFKLIKEGWIQVWNPPKVYLPGNINHRKQRWFLQQRRIPKYTPYDIDNQIVEFYDYIGNIGDPRVFPLGVMGYKLFDINIVNVEKQPDYTRGWADIITGATATIEKIKNSENPLSAYCEQFPTSRIAKETAEQMPNNQDVADMMLFSS